MESWIAFTGGNGIFVVDVLVSFGIVILNEQQGPTWTDGLLDELDMAFIFFIDLTVTSTPLISCGISFVLVINE